jgi:hypothetical protein
MKQTAITHGGQQAREGELLAKYPDAQIAFSEGHGGSRPKNPIPECPHIFLERSLVFGSPVHVIKNRSRQPLLRQSA